MKTQKTITAGIVTLFLAAAGLSSQSAQAQSLKINSAQKGTPAYYVDGVLTSNEVLNNTKPDDIENINVVKDKQAVASFGPAAMNGAVVVTTKKNKDSEAVKAFNN